LENLGELVAVFLQELESGIREAPGFSERLLPPRASSLEQEHLQLRLLLVFVAPLFARLRLLLVFVAPLFARLRLLLVFVAPLFARLRLLLVFVAPLSVQLWPGKELFGLLLQSSCE
jgi:hypothetical protein